MLSFEDLLERAVKECLMKNFIIIVLCFLFYRNLTDSLAVITPNQMGDFLLLISILLVTACFANFAFSYEFSIIDSMGMRLLSHATTFIFMLLIALLLESMVIGIAYVYGNLLALVLVFSVLLYLGCALYDFWDLFRSFKGNMPQTVSTSIRIDRGPVPVAPQPQGPEPDAPHSLP
jgi:hypothetical protein